MRSGRTSATVAVLSVAVIVGLVVFLPDGDTPDPLAGGAPTVAEDARAEGDLPAPVETEARLLEVTDAEVTGEASDALHDDPGEGTAGVVVHGTIVVVDTAGTEHAAESGTLSLHLWSPVPGRDVLRSTEQRELAVEDGAWTTRLDPGQTISLGPLELGGRTTHSAMEGSLELPADGRVALRARWPDEAVLVVRSSVSGQELAAVELVICDVFGDLEGPHEGCAVAGQHTSPIVLDGLTQGSGARPVFARAPGHAWGSITVDFSQGGEYLLVLEPGGDLVLQLDGPSPPVPATIRVYPVGKTQDSPEREQRLVVADDIRVDSLAAGERTVSIEVGDWFREPTVLARGDVTIVAGTETVLRLELASAGVGERADLAGTLVIPPAWELTSDPRITLERSGASLLGQPSHVFVDSSRVPGSPDRWQFSRTGLEAGTYLVELDQPAHAEEFVLPPEGLDDLVVEVPEPCRLEVTVVEEATGLPYPAVQLMWSAKDGGAWTNTMADVDQDGSFRFQVPPGEVVVSVHGDIHVDGHGRIDAVPGLNPFELRVRAASGFVPVLKEGDTVVPWPQFSYPAVQALEGDGKASGYAARGNRLSVRVDKPGRYRLELPELSGYRPVADPVIDVPAGQFIDVVIELERIL